MNFVANAIYSISLKTFIVILVSQVALEPMKEVEETLVQSLDWEESLGEGMATHSSILAWKFLPTEEPSGLQSTGFQRAGHD